MRQHRTLLVIDQHFGRDPVEPLEAPDQALIGMLGILTRRAPEVEPARVVQRVHEEVDDRRLAADDRLDLAPVALQLLARRRLKPDGGPAGSQRPFRADVVAQDRQAAPITLHLELPEDHHPVPHALTQQPIDLRPIAIQQAWSPGRRPGRRRPTPLQRPLHRLRVDAQGLGDVSLRDTAFRQCLNRHEVLLRQHPSLLELPHSVKGHSCWRLGDFSDRCFADFYHRS